MTDFPHTAEGERLLAEINRLRAELAETQLQRQTRLFAEYPAERCQKAEAEIDRLRAELADQAETLRVTDDFLFRAVEDARKAEAKLAKVRELCHPDTARRSKVTVYKARLLAAIGEERA